MKNIKFKISNLLVILGSFLIFTGCSDSFLDLQNPNNPNDKIFWQSKDNAESALAAIYSPIRGQMYGPYSAMTGYQIQNVRADDTWAVLGEDSQIWVIANYTNNAGQGYNDFKYLYASINRANVFLQKIEETPMDGDLKNKWISEVKFLRAFNYFYLVREYNQVPLRLISPSWDIAESHKASASNEAVWTQIELDLKGAIEFLPIDNNGRATKGAAIALLGKTYIYQEKYKEGADQLALLKKAPFTYALVDKPEDNFRGDTKQNKESVFELMYEGVGGIGGDATWDDETANYTLGNVLPLFFGPEGTGGWFKIMPSATIIEAFIKEERPAGADTKFDKRLYASCYFKYSDYGDVVADETWYGGKTFDEIWTGTEGKISKGQPVYPKIHGKDGRFLMKKFTNFFLDEDKSNNVEAKPENRANNVRVMRYAEVLLLNVEACIKTGDLGTARADLKLIRDRAGLPEKSWANADELWDEMEHQKFLELYFENQRWYDLKRWYPMSKVKDILMKNNKQGADNMQEKHAFLPIPQSELNSNIAIEQNAPWK